MWLYFGNIQLNATAGQKLCTVNQIQKIKIKLTLHMLNISLILAYVVIMCKSKKGGEGVHCAP